MPSPLTPGTTIGGYVVEQLLGHGGMGDVYLARDLAQHRLVALKVLPSDAAHDSRRRERMQLEGRVLQSLRHTNICSVYEVGEDSGHIFIAMEYVEGRTLHDVASNERLPVERVIEIGCELASALDAARHAGIVHRDLKGANVMVLPSGAIKVLDFGLAKFATSSEQRLMNPAPRATEPGLIFGTAEFMSPEQALGREVDHRSDLFSLGVMLFELLTGALPFKGTTRMELFWEIMNAPPPKLADANPLIPVPLVAIVERLLEKNARDRYQTADRVLTDLEMLRPKREDLKEARRKTRRRWFRRLAGSAAGVLLALALVPLLQFGTYWVEDRLERSSLLPSSVWVGTEAVYDMQPRITGTINPRLQWIGNDGRMIYTTLQTRDRGALWLSVPGQPEPTLVVKDAADAAMAPDGRTIYFVGAGSLRGLYRTSLPGAEPTLLASGEAQRPFLSRDAKVVTFVRPSPSGFTLWAVPTVGDAPYQLSPVVWSSAPFVSPDLTRVAWLEGEQVTICDVAACAERKNFDLTTLVGWTPDGSAILHQGPPGLSNIWMTKIADGGVHQITRFSEDSVTSIAWSPDGHRLAVTRHRGLGDVDWTHPFK